MNHWGRVFAWLICLALVLGMALPAFAEDTAAETAAEPEIAVSEEVHESILDGDALTKMVEDFLAQKGIPKDRVGVGFCYTATGDEWFFNPDTWFYPGSMYKVPLMMILAERVRDGQVDPDTQIGGLGLSTVFEYILVNSNNDYAHAVRKFLIDGQGGDEIWREEAKQYARLDSYDERYILYCYFSPRYMTQVLETLYADPDRFPRVMDCLLKAEQGHYFRLPDEMHQYDVAQKYGSYLDQENSNWNHTAGIIYTPNPFILTVMTKNVGDPEHLIGQLGVMFKDYALSVDEKYAAYQQEQAQKEAERLAAEEAARLAAEAAAQPTAKPSVSLFSSQSQTQPAQQTQTSPADPAARYERARSAGMIVLAILLGAAILGGIAAVIIVKEKERRRYEYFRRRFEAEMRQEALERERAQQRGAQPTPRPRTSEAPQQRASRPETPPVRRVSRPSAQRPESMKRADPQIPDGERWVDDEEDE